MLMLGPKKILVVGDVILDISYKGKVNRVSPEAPIPALLYEEMEYSLGGAANLTSNLIAAGQDATLVSIIGSDKYENTLREMLVESGISDKYIFSFEKYTTCVKYRFRAQNDQQLLRVDVEDPNHNFTRDDTPILALLKEVVGDFDLVIISDYCKGLLDEKLTQSIIHICKSYGIRVIIDVKNTTIRKYKGANILKPNLQELSFLTKKPVKNIEEIIAASHYLCKKSCAEYVLTTCGSAGMVLVNPFGLIKYINSTRINAHDVTGAGDTAIAYFGAALANNIEVCNAMSIANIDAGIQVMKTGAAVITWQEVYEELIQLSEKNANRKILQVSDLSSLRELYSTKKIVFTNGCFDLLHIGHIHCLLSASNYGDILVVGINSDSSIKRIKGEERPVIPQNERVEILSALECVDYVILYEEDTPYNIISELQPDVLVKGGDYDATSIVGCDIVKKRGGEIQTVEIKHNTSSTKIIERILNQYKGKNNEPE